jgi:hypothetical protein
MSATTFADLNSLAAHLRQKLETKDFVLLYAYNGTGKTRLSAAFKDAGKRTVFEHAGMGGGMGQPLMQETTVGDTLYFNAFTEDLFSWDNDLENDQERVLRINQDSRFFAGLGELEMDNRIRPLLNRYADFDFKIDTDVWNIRFSRQITTGHGDTAKVDTVDSIKISRGEENIFIWCFFLAIVQLALDKAEAYKWVEYIYIDDPISSLDEGNAIAVANHLAQLLTASNKGPKTVVSTHHVLFFNVLSNELKKKTYHYLLGKGQAPGSLTLEDSNSTPFLHHLASLVELNEVQKTGNLQTHHFNMMRRAMEQTASFFGLTSWRDCIKVEETDPEKPLYKRLIDLMSHGDYSLYEPRVMLEENKNHFRQIFRQFIAHHPFNPSLFPSIDEVTT